ncbi:hypothetical protein BCR33DRAFT_720203 [Rhizoclosmatium globosum]|uniref:Ribosomal protein S2 n=1 Tax=Rhizoclosmatium globosum TaxID=329046 RepID=A0A1Y2BXJ0_9FUNG|nr:hypothetical protein BCR33DRAFT_720203 [Rhizoclosmatium globosum]|eukprot:ORY39367.1 hypothetical protein BCR33DRAFT_720203 [Rhizoclosmatium globosum]
MAATPTQRLLRLLPTQSLPRVVPPSSRSSSSTDHVNHALSVSGLMAANAHLGASSTRQHANMLRFVHGVRGGVSVLNLDATLAALRRACAVAAAVAPTNIVFVGTRRAIHRIAADAALASGAAFVTKWVGGSLTNKERVLKRSVRFDPDRVTQLQTDDKDVLDRQPRVKLPDLVILLDMNNNLHAVREANQLNIPIIAITDSDCDPNLVQYPIPANDDSLSSVGLIAGLLSKAISDGAAIRSARPPRAPRSDRDARSNSESSNSSNNYNNNKRASPRDQPPRDQSGSKSQRAPKQQSTEASTASAPKPSSTVASTSE